MKTKYDEKFKQMQEGYVRATLRSNFRKSLIYYEVFEKVCKDCMVKAICTRSLDDGTICEKAYIEVMKYAKKVLTDGITL